jgi:phosphinothricin acetyltransferase
VTAGAVVTVRAATRDDLPQLTGIYNHYVADTATTFDVEPFTVEQRTEWFERYSTEGRHRLLVARMDGAVAGYASSSRFHARAAYDTTVEMTVLCAPEAVGLRLGQRLYTSMFEELSREDIHLAVALITLPNDASCALHERFRFTRAGTLPEAGRKFGRYWDVAYYARRMDSP